MSETKRKLIFDLIFIVVVYRGWNWYAWISRADRILYPYNFGFKSVELTRDIATVYEI